MDSRHHIPVSLPLHEALLRLAGKRNVSIETAAAEVLEIGLRESEREPALPQWLSDARKSREDCAGVGFDVVQSLREDRER